MKTYQLEQNAFFYDFLGTLRLRYQIAKMAKFILVLLVTNIVHVPN